jgi:pimeloyl-ACP methyl ester carboxylesterase
VPHEDVDLWALYDRIRCPTLVIRGAESDLLLRATVDEMQQRGPRAKAVELPGIGHAPTLMHADQIALVRDFLLA